MEADVVISVEQLSKSYQLGEIGATSLRESVERILHRLRGRDPVSEMAKLSSGTSRSRGASNENRRGNSIWALRDISFDVRKGEVLGLIGKNGAGKSTLLKILTRITEPTAGRAVLRGRVASLLEVGTGFHPELTGRDNVYLSGAILGMKKHEIASRFDEIVAFAEIAPFIDTPVKRYSSGMYVRLAFSVAAHLEPDILLIDEVLAVGDIAFQKKCLGRMSEEAGAGRTVLFVSHNMQAVRQLCQRAIWIDGGKIVADGSSGQVVEDYIKSVSTTPPSQTVKDAIRALPSDPVFCLRRVALLQDGVETSDVLSGKAIHLSMEYDVAVSTPGLHVCTELYDEEGTLLFESLHNGAESDFPTVSAGRYISTVEIPPDFLTPRTYQIRFKAGIADVRALVNYISMSMTVHPVGLVNRAYPGYQTRGRLAPLLNWKTVREQ